MAGPTSPISCKKVCVCGPFYKGGKINYPLWWYGDQDVLYNFAGGSATPVNCVWMNNGLYFNGGSSYLEDEQGRKILKEGTTGLWSSINLDGNEVPPCGSVTGSGSVLCLNNGSAIPPKIENKLVLYSQGCPNLTTFKCNNNLFSTIDVGTVTSLTKLYCHYNSTSKLDVSALISLTYLYCNNNYITILDVSALTSLTRLYCHNNDMNQAMVDTVLCDVNGYGTNNDTLNISGNAVPSAVGITCKDELEGRGWAVTTD